MTFFKQFERSARAPSVLAQAGLLSGLLVGLGVLVACGSEEVKPGPCDGVLAAVCGGACAEDVQCPTGTHCGAGGTCTAECTQSSFLCTTGCSAQGRCSGEVLSPVTASPVAGGSGQLLIGPGGASTSGSGNGVNTQGEACIQVVQGFDRVTPTVMLLIDRSGSMNQDFGGNSRWNVVRDTLTDPNNGLVSQLQSEVRFGLSLYSSENPGDDPTQFDVCPNLVNVGVALSNFTPINQVFGQAEPLVHTPTGESVQAVTAQLLADPDTSPKVIVLATDGDPDTCQDGDDHSNRSKRLSVNAVESAFNAGIRTFVINVGEDADRNHIEDLARAGQNSQAASSYAANDSAQLEAAFRDIIGGVRGCTFSLQGEVPASQASRGTVIIGGAALQFGDDNGWFMPTTSSVEIRGQACEALMAGTADVNISFPCLTPAEIAR